ncbi:MAG TPA: TRAP transporter fused permease subunit [Alphaproteobacteria bacterium]|nr:TRAP transporter fused permease subunit [Alphaproteobacteria bacterium]
MAKRRLLDPGTRFSVGCRRRPGGWLGWLITPFAFAIAVYVVLAATWVILDPWVLSATFLSGMMALGFLTVGATPESDTERVPLFDILLAALSIAAGIYFVIIAEDEVARINLLFPLDSWRIVFGAIVCVLTFEITRRTTGLGLTLIVAIFVLYNFFGHHLGGVLKHGYISPNHFLDIMVFTTDGIMGLPVRVAATYAFLFVMFGTLMYYAKGSDFFFDFAAAIAGRKPGGPAKVAVVSSGMYGMISGSPTSDVVTTGSITIPIMKRLGYKGSVAGAIEVAASTGGSVMPPVMGSAAFIMAEYTGIEYVDIAVAAFLPAMLYYTCVYSQVHFRAVKLGFGGLDPERIPRLKPVLLRGGLFLVPLIVLTWFLLEGYTPTWVAVTGSVAVVAVAVAYKLIDMFIAWRRDGGSLSVPTLVIETWRGVVLFYKALAETSMRMVPVAGATAAAGLVIAGITMTGLAAKFAHVIYAITDAQVFSALVVAAMVTIVLGMGMPTPSAYILAAVLIGPLMNQLNVDPLPGHMFLLYFAVMSAITPPVAVAAYAASSIAEDNPLGIAANAVKLALAAFLVPFVFVYGPELLWLGPLWKTALTFASAAAGLILIAAAIEAYEAFCASLWARFALAAAGLLLLVPFYTAAAAGVVLAALTIAANRMTRRSATARG